MMLQIKQAALFAQKNVSIDSVEFCCPQPDLDDIYKVVKFKATLILNIEVSKVYCEGKATKIKFKHSEEFQNKTKVIPLHDDLAIQIAIIRAYKDGVQFYLFDVFFFGKQDNTMTEVSPHKWEFLSLGEPYFSRWYGEENTINFYGFEGCFTIE
jgi:hypothetical protein